MKCFFNHCRFWISSNTVRMRLFFRIAKIFLKLANVFILMKLTYSMKSLLIIWLKNFKTNSTFGKRILKKTGLEFGTFTFLPSFVTLFMARVTPIIEFSVELDYRTRTFITLSWFETALGYKPQIFWWIFLFTT